MTPLVIETLADLRLCPEPKSPADTTYSVTLGDLHGNALKLLYFLICEGVLSLAHANDYPIFVEIYTKGIKDITIEDVKAMKKIVHQSTVYNDTKIRLIGDEFADRGSNDYFTVLLLQKLHQQKVNLDIIISNHGSDFIYAYESGNFLESFSRNILPYQSGSIYALRTLIKKFPEIDLLSEITEFIKDTYTKSLRLIDYDIDLKNNKIYIFTHAPCDLALIKDVAEILETPYDDKTLSSLVKTIDGIQQNISEYLFQSSLSYILQNEVVWFLLWNRNTEQLIDPMIPRKIHRIEYLHDYAIHYVHGHTEGHSSHYITNLDTPLGKSESEAASFMSTPQIIDHRPLGTYKVLRILRQ